MEKLQSILGNPLVGGWLVETRMLKAPIVLQSPRPTVPPDPAGGIMNDVLIIEMPAPSALLRAHNRFRPASNAGFFWLIRGSTGRSPHRRKQRMIPGCVREIRAIPREKMVAWPDADCRHLAPRPI